MNRVDHTERKDSGTPDRSTTIRRVLVESGVRPVQNRADAHDGQSSTMAAITSMTKQHEDEQRELQDLNKKMVNYVDNVQRLENRNAHLQGKIADLRQSRIGDLIELQNAYGSQLQAVRSAVDDTVRDQLQQEVRLKRLEYDSVQMQQLIAAAENPDALRLVALQEELNMTAEDLKDLKSEFDRRMEASVQLHTNLHNAANALEGLGVELENHRLERIMIENELKTLQEQRAFEDAIYQVQREEFINLATPVLDVSTFYSNELARAISDMRHDFEVLSHSQVRDLEEYYRVKTEHIEETLTREAERRQLLNSRQEIANLTALSEMSADLAKEYKALQDENGRLQAEFDDVAEDLARIRNEHFREQESQAHELNRLQHERADKQAMIDNLLENTTSLQFEISTYRRLLNSEEQRLNQLEQGKGQTGVGALASALNPTHRRPSEATNDNVTVQKMAIKKSSQGPVVFDSIDFVNDAILVTYDKFTGEEQSLGNWTLRQEVDQQAPKQYKFPSTLTLRPRQTVCVLSKGSPPSARADKDVLTADQIDTWAAGQVVVTRLIDANNVERANITHSRVPA